MNWLVKGVWVNLRLSAEEPHLRFGEARVGEQTESPSHTVSPPGARSDNGFGRRGDPTPVTQHRDRRRPDGPDAREGRERADPTYVVRSPAGNGAEFPGNHGGSRSRIC